MYQKPEPTSEHSYPCHVLNVVEQLCREMSSTWGTSSHLAKEATLELMGLLIANAIAQLEESSELQSSTISANRQDTGELPPPTTMMLRV